MGQVLQINFALWGMILCSAFKASQLIQYAFEDKGVSTRRSQQAQPASGHSGSNRREPYLMVRLE